MSTKSDITTTVKAEDTGPAFVETIHPITGEPVLLRDPVLQVVDPRQAAVSCETIESFGAAVAALAGPNKLVELRSPGEFAYLNDLAGRTTRSVRMGLIKAPTVGILCLAGPKEFRQRDLIKWGDQWPETLTPMDVDRELTFAALQNFVVKGASSFSSQVGETMNSISALRDEGPETAKIPLYWEATSAVFQDGEPQTVKLRLEVVIPEIKDNKLQGELLFKFELWSPAPVQIMDAAMADAIARMQAVLPADMTIIRGSIA